MEIINGSDYIPNMTVRVFMAMYCREASEFLWDGQSREAAKRLLRGLHSNINDFSMPKHIMARRGSIHGAEMNTVIAQRFSGKFRSEEHDWHYVKPVRSKRG